MGSNNCLIQTLESPPTVLARKKPTRYGRFTFIDSPSAVGKDPIAGAGEYACSSCGREPATDTSPINSSPQGISEMLLGMGAGIAPPSSVAARSAGVAFREGSVMINSFQSLHAKQDKRHAHSIAIRRPESSTTPLPRHVPHR